MSTDPIPYRKDLRKKMGLEEEENSDNTNDSNVSDSKNVDIQTS